MAEIRRIASAPLQVPAYEQETVKVKDFVHDITKNPAKRTKEYLLSLFPILQWIYRYNFVWLYSDVIAGLTVGVVVVPQGMSYAKVATLPPEYGLYASFVGVMIYCFFATSKDVSIGPVAVMSLQVSKVISEVISSHPEYANSSVQIAMTLAFLCGIVALGIGVLRLGFILEYISMPAVLGYMTGSAFTILVGQVPALMGISQRFNTRDASYLVVINTLKNLKYSTLDAAFGLVPLFILYFTRWFFDFASKRYPKYKQVWFFGSVLRNAFVIIFATLISWGVCRHYDSKDYPISILKKVPRGLQDVGYHPIDKKLASAIAPQLPISTVILLLEHISIAKSFGRLNDYKINPNQELIAIGVTNTIGTFFNAYPATGSFSRSALKSKCGVRTPLAGIFTGIVVLIAIYALTSAFYWIPNATLSAIIIHAVSDLMASWRVTYKIWKTSPLELVMFVGAVLLSVFISMEAGIYFSAAASLVFLLLRISFADGQFLGRVQVIQVRNAYVMEEEQNESEPEDKSVTDSEEVQVKSKDDTVKGYYEYFKRKVANETYREKSKTKENSNKESKNYDKGLVSGRSIRTIVPHYEKKYKWVPLSHKNINEDVAVLPPPRGVFVFRPSESFTYPTCSRQVDKLVAHIRLETQRGGEKRHLVKLGDRPWNDHGPRNLKPDPDFVDTRPILRAVVLDFSMTPHIDLTGVHALLDAKQVLSKYANREVEFHFVGIMSPWARRALLAESFGGVNGARPENYIVELAAVGPQRNQEDEGIFDSGSSGTSLRTSREYRDEEERDTFSALGEDGRYIPVVATNTPFFHLDIPDLHFEDDPA